MDLYTMYHEDIPAFLYPFMHSAAMERLKGVGMNCGVEYTSFPRFVQVMPYSRYDHSLGAALIVYHFTGDKKQTIAALLHDIATPAFAHVIDFLHGDHLKQESTEAGTREIIEGDPGIVRALRSLCLAAEDVCDYHRYPIADNDTPRLSADRLEYTLSNALSFGFSTREQLGGLYSNLKKGTAEGGAEELVFTEENLALRFARLSLCCSRVYTSPEDRYAMQHLAELLRSAIQKGILREEALYRTEREVIDRLEADKAFRAAWQAFCRLHSIQAFDTPMPGALRVAAKKRRIDPYVEGRGRVSSLFPEYAKELQAYALESHAQYLLGGSD